MVNEQLIFATLVEKAATYELVLAAFPGAILSDSYMRGDDDEIFNVLLRLDVPEHIFFRWAAESGVVDYCFNLSLLMLADPPAWMINVLNTLHHIKRLGS